MSVLLLILGGLYLCVSGFAACLGCLDNPWVGVYLFFCWPWEVLKNTVLWRFR